MSRLRAGSIFLLKDDESAINSTFSYAMNKIIENKEMIRIKDLAGSVYYSEKQLNRLFQKYVGVGVKTFSRIVRIKHAVNILDNAIDISKLVPI